jgi:polyisoprenoid-binding protein YceI
MGIKIKISITTPKTNNMKHVIYPVLASILLVSSAFVSITSAPDYKIKDGFSIDFKSKDPSGEFKTMKGDIKFNESDLGSSKFDLTIDVSSISTGNNMKNKKSQTEEWFHASKHPSIRYVSTKIEKSGNDYTVYGNLTMKGITKEKQVPLKVSKNGSELTFNGNFKVNRIDFKVGKKSQAVPDEMNISYSIPVSQK